MKAQKLIQMPNHAVETRAIELVLAHERARGRKATDAREILGPPVDVISIDPATKAQHVIEVKALGGSGRGDDLWLEPAQVEALETAANPHLYIVTNVRSADPDAIRIIDLSGEALKQRLQAKRHHEYYTVPLPVAIYDDLSSKPMDPRGITGTEFVRRVLEAVTVLHARGYHRIRYVAAYAPTGLHVRVHVGQDTELPSEDMAGAVFEKLAYTSVDNAFLMERDLSGHAVTAGMNADQIADVILGAIPPIDATNDDPEYAARLKELLERFDGRVDSVLTQRGF